MLVSLKFLKYKKKIIFLKASPAKKFVNEKEKLLSDLTNSLQEKIEEVAKLSELNFALKQKLQEFQLQNEENAKIFQQENMNSSIKYKQLNESHKMLQAEVSKNAEKINELVLKNHSLTKVTKQSEDYEIKVFRVLIK